MKKYTSLFILLLLLNFNIEASELQLICKTGLFSSSEIVQQGSSIFLDGKKYPEKTEKINSAGYLWTEIRQVDKRENKLVFEQFSMNKNEYIPEVEYFIIDLKDLSFIKGVEMNEGRVKPLGSMSPQRTIKSLSERSLQWLDSSSGKCRSFE